MLRKKGYKHKEEFSINRKGILNPMSNREKSQEFIAMQKRDKKGENNPLFGKKKSPETLSKMIKLVYVYNSSNSEYIGTFSTVNCAREFKIGKDTLQKYLKKGLAFKGLIFSRIKLH